MADPDGDERIEDFLLDYASQLLTIVMTPRLMQVRRLVIAEVERFPQLGEALHERGPMRSIRRLAVAFRRYREKGDIRVKDAEVAGGFFNWLVMGGPVNDAMLLGDSAIPTPEVLRAHASEAVRIFLAAHRPG
ncbi:TetR/AcrR family transcriptional regulator C-terminal domain-containing protein [Ensifer adhaerens]